MIFFLEIPCFFLFFFQIFFVHFLFQNFCVYCCVALQEYVSIGAFIVVSHG